MNDLLFSCGAKICNLINYLATKSKGSNRSGLGFSNIRDEYHCYNKSPEYDV